MKIAAETQTDAAIGAYVARHGDQAAGDAGRPEHFFGLEGMAKGFDKDDTGRLVIGHKCQLGRMTLS